MGTCFVHLQIFCAETFHAHLPAQAKANAYQVNAIVSQVQTSTAVIFPLFYPSLC
jgi:hypothetical protein